MRKILVIVCLAFAAQSVRAQQDALFSQYMFNHLLINPAYAGSHDYMMATLLYRNQWVKWDNAPTTEAATLHGPLGNTNLGWGGSLTHDHEGVTDRTDFFLNLAYHIKLTEKLKLGMGLRGGLSYWVRKNSDLVYWDPNDPKFEGDKTTNILPNVGAGFYLYSKRFYAGLSAPEVLAYDPNNALSVNGDEGKEIPRQKQHYFLTSGVAIPVSPDVVLKPSVLLKFVPNAPVEADINLNVLLANILWLGVSYRTEDAVVAMVEIQLSRKLRLGYAYDFTMSDVKDYSTGSHEIMLAYDFGYDIMKIKTPRYF
jgi:type IX secretion system PorP/SprF family membrane protein